MELRLKRESVGCDVLCVLPLEYIRMSLLPSRCRCCPPTCFGRNYSDHLQGVFVTKRLLNGATFDAWVDWLRCAVCVALCITYIWVVPGSNLACDTGCFESLHALPQFFKADSRIVDLPELSVFFNIQYLSSSNHTTLHSLVSDGISK
jgi:hypothetical protein